MYKYKFLIFIWRNWHQLISHYMIFSVIGVKHDKNCREMMIRHGSGLQTSHRYNCICTGLVPQICLIHKIYMYYNQKVVYFQETYFFPWALINFSFEGSSCSFVVVHNLVVHKIVFHCWKTGLSHIVLIAQWSLSTLSFSNLGLCWSCIYVWSIFRLLIIPVAHRIWC
jgi:hypothetical protein